MDDVRLRPRPISSSSSRVKPPKAVDTTTANHTPTTSSSSSSTSAAAAAGAPRTPRSPFGAWTGPPKTPLTPHFARQAPVEVMALLLLAIVLLCLFVLAALQDLGGGWTPRLGELRVKPVLEESVAGTALAAGGGGAGGIGGGQVGMGQAVEEESTSRGLGSGYAVGEGAVPSFPPVRLAVRDAMEFQDTGERGHEAWLRMLPEGDGLVKVAQPRRHGLPQSQRLVDEAGGVVGDVEVFEVAVVRELECLLAVRQLLGRYEGREKEVTEDETRDVHRCLDHLRQAILCHADTTMERVGEHAEQGWSRRHGPDGSPVVDLDSSEGTLRTCRDWNRIKHWLEENRADVKL